MTVQYSVEENTYEIKETVKLKSETIKIGKIHIGQRKTAVMPNVTVGADVVVLYNPEKPYKAYIRDNTGIMNC